MESEGVNSRRISACHETVCRAKPSGSEKVLGRYYPQPMAKQIGSAKTTTRMNQVRAHRHRADLQHPLMQQRAMLRETRIGDQPFVLSKAAAQMATRK